jgi:hypothetical protein
MNDPVVRQAIKNVVGRHSLNDWYALTPRQQAQAIYDEIRRLDLQAAKLKRKVTQQDNDALVDAV